MRDAFVRALMRQMEADPRVVLITGDLGFGVLRPVTFTGWINIAPSSVQTFSRTGAAWRMRVIVS